MLAETDLLRMIKVCWLSRAMGTAYHELDWWSIHPVDVVLLHPFRSCSNGSMQGTRR